MEMLIPTASIFAASAVSALFSAVWEGAVLAVSVFLFLRLFPRLSAAARSGIWITVFLLLVLLHVAPFSGVRVSSEMAMRPAAIHLGVVWSSAIAGAWIVLSLIRGVGLGMSAIRVRGLARGATVLDPSDDVRRLLESEALGGMVRRRAELCTSCEVERPSVLGFFRPRILLPPALVERLTPAELRQVVVHEMEHLRRGDDWTNLMQKLALVVFPLNPVLLWVERRLCAERELACDDSVLRANGGRKAYAICLTHLAEYSILRRGLSLALGAWERQSELVRRVHRILRRPVEGMSRRQTLALSGSLIAGVAACALGLARSPQLVSFDTAAAHAAAEAAMPSTSFRAMNVMQVGRGQTGMQPAHAEMVKATMPEARNGAAYGPVQGVAVNGRSAPDRRPASGNVALRDAALRSAKRRSSTVSRQAWVVMTAWSESDAAPQIVFAVAQDDRNAGEAAGQEPGNDKPGTGRQGMAGRQGIHAKTNSKGVPAMSDAVIRTYAVPLPDGWLIIQI